MAITVEIDESDRQMILLALSLTTLLRPGFHYCCGEIAKKFSGEEFFEMLRHYNADVVRPRGGVETPPTGPPAVHILLHGLPLCQFSTRVPGDWPEGHKWISFQDAENGDQRVTCEGCKKGFENEINDRKNP